MFIGFFINLILGFIFVYVGFLIWKKKKINLIHAYHYKNVKNAAPGKGNPVHGKFRALKTAHGSRVAYPDMQ